MNRANWHFALFALTASVLTGCATTTPPEGTPPPVRYDYALSVDVTPQDTRAELEARYGGDALIWYPDAGFAVLGVEGSLTPPGELNVLNAEVRRESNRDAFSIPSVNAQGRNAWAGGRNAWAGGWGAWTGEEKGAPTTLEENLAAWRQVGLAGAQPLAAPGKGVKVAVIDSGVDVYHPALQGKLAPEGEWRDYIDGDKLPLDEEDPDSDNTGHGHGTGVAGIILQVAPEATILPLRVLGPDGSGDLTDVAMAIDHAAKQGADIINLSLGSDGDTGSLAVSKVLTHVRERYGVLFVVSSGNTGDEKITFPANLARRGEHDSLVSVGSVDAQNVRSSFSTYGPNISLYAPGETVYTLMPDQGVTHATGTSFAAPVVAGALALALSAEEGERDAASFVQALLSSANYAIDSRDDTRTGMLDVGRFLGAAKGVAGEVVLSGGTVLENQAVGTVVGHFSVIGDDGAGGSRPSYSLVAGEADNGSFTLVGDELRTAARFDFETKRSYGVLVEVGSEGGYTQKSFTVSVQDLDDENPVVAFDNPGVLTEGEPVTLTGSAADNVGVSRLELYEGVTLLGEAILSDTVWRYDYTPTSIGTVTLKVVAKDAAGNVAEAGVTVKVEGWSVQFGDAATEDDAESITVDAEGNLYIAGKTNGNWAGTNAGSRDAFVIKLDSRGERLWADQFGTSNNDEAEHIAVDAGGNFYVVGYTYGSLEPGGSNAGSADAFVAQYRADGTRGWRKQFGEAGRDKAMAVVVDAAGDIYIAGHTTSHSVDANRDDHEVFVTKYDSGGAQQWFRQFGSPANDEGNAIAIDAAGSVYITGHTDGNINGSGSSKGGFDIFVAKYLSNGDQAWLEQFGSDVDDKGKGIVVDAAGGVYVVGYTRGDLARNNVGNSDAVIAKYSSSGNPIWLEQFGSTSDDDGAYAAAIDARGNVVLTGYTRGEAAGTAFVDILNAGYDSAGQQVWTQQLDNAEYEETDGIAADAQGNVFITGYAKSTLDGTPIVGTNIFVTKIVSGNNRE